MNKFPKSQRLHNKKQIEELFSIGASFTVYPLKVVYLKKPTDSLTSNQVLVSVPKSNFKNAVDRNKIKRRIKEAYRLQRDLLNSPQHEFYLLIGYIYMGKESVSYRIIEEKLKQTLLRLKEIISS